jgi:tetratricopeptide (TPR) repeat protein
MKRIVNIAIISALVSGWTACGGEGKKKNTGQQQEAIPAVVVAMQEAVQKNRDSAGLRLRLVDMLDSIGQYKQAASEMDSLLRKDSLNYGLWYTKGQVLEHGQDTANAIICYSNAIRVYPAPDALLSLANLYAEKKDGRTLAIVNNVKDMRLGRETDAHCAFIAGVYFARTKKRQEALQQFDNCIANNYTYMEAYIEKGLVYFDNKQYKEALDVFRFSSSVNTLYADTYYYQARAYEMLDKKDSAVLKFQQALSLDKSLKEAHTALHRLGAE